MATPLLIDDIILVTHGTYVSTHAQEGLIRMYYQVVAGGSETYEDLAGDIFNRSRNAWQAWMPTVAKYTGVSVTRLPINAAGATVPKVGPIYFVSTVTGSNGNNMLPLQASCLGRWKVAGLNLTTVPPTVPNRKGRTYLPFIAVPSYDQTAQKINNAGVGLALQLLSTMGPSMVLAPKGANLKMVLRRTGKPTPPSKTRPLIGYSDVTGLSTAFAVATQRRRGDFGRVNSPFGGIQ